jgi:fused signal recognition particle receptor
MFNWLRKPAPPRPQPPGESSPPHPPEAESGPAAIPEDAPAPLEPAAAPPHAAPPSAPAEAGAGLFGRLKRGLAKTRALLNTDIEDLFAGRRTLGEELREQLEELLITADVGVQTTMALVEAIVRRAPRIATADELRGLLREEILALLRPREPERGARPPDRPEVVLVVGVNGVGKTTTIGKLAALHARQGRRVVIAAADTFRAAAGEQLAVWAERSGARLVRHKDGSDPAAVAYDGVETALARGEDLVLIDTAGRLHTKVNLMEELKKIARALSKRIPGAPHQVLLVLDATTGQNAISQVRLFKDAVGVTGMILTKLDGTAKGGIVIGICGMFDIPLHFVGVGEALDDLQLFDPERFVAALF